MYLGFSGLNELLNIINSSDPYLSLSVIVFMHLGIFIFIIGQHNAASSRGLFIQLCWHACILMCFQLLCIAACMCPLEVASVPIYSPIEKLCIDNFGACVLH